MINVLLPMAGDSSMFDAQQYPYPLPLTELGGKPMIEHVIANLRTLDPDVRFIFVVKSADCRRYHLDHTLSLLSRGQCAIVRLEGETRGALCSALMAINEIHNETPLVISNFDQLIEPGFSALFGKLRATGCDAGCLSFDSVHPRWSYARLEGEQVVEAAEKKPISRNAIAGFYYFSEGQLFIRAAMQTILKQASINDKYFISPVFNELILDGRLVSSMPVPSGAYHSFYTPQRIDEYERLVTKT